MSCCAVAGMYADPARSELADEVLLASRSVETGVRQTDLSVPGIHCGACIGRVETALAKLPGVRSARVNLSSKRATILWNDAADPPPFIETLRGIGYQSHLHDITSDDDDRKLGALIRALAIAGFAATNIMMLSVGVWTGADEATRTLFHWLSALIALPALIYSGRIFFRSAWTALRHGRTNMDVPISIGVLLSFALSLYETAHHGAHAYFDASVSLLFFLLIGRVLDHMMRDRARTAVRGLSRLSARGALVLDRDDSRVYLPVDDLRPGMKILLAAGDRVPVDAHVLSGESEIDLSIQTGESIPVPVSAGVQLRAGALNLTGPLTIVATAAASDSFLAEMRRLMEAAESGRSIHRRIADRAARLYAPAIHSIALATFIGWVIATGDVHRALTIAIAVLIVTCPCALGLAVPMVQVVAARRLFERGILLRDGGSLERLAEIDSVIVDKTGTLTLGQPRLLDRDRIDPAALEIAAALAEQSRHPYSRALVSSVPADGKRLALTNVSEHAGAGMEARIGGHDYRLGRRDWALASRGDDTWEANVVLACDGRPLANFRFEDRLRPGAPQAIEGLRRRGLQVEILSGDRDATVREVADKFGVAYFADVLPAGKLERLAALGEAGHKTLMVGDGLNDAPALARAYVSMAPASAADISRSAADLVFLHESLQAVPQALAIARSAKDLVVQNLWLAIGYNVLAVPIAVMGQVTPLVAAIAMSSSSVIVTANALRLRGEGGPARREGRNPHGASASGEHA